MNDVPKENKAFRMFISYSHEDKELRDRMEISLAVLKQQGLISTWNDGQIVPGERWEQKILDNRDSADIVLFLVSPNFMASGYIREKELLPILKREKEGNVYVLVVQLRPTFLKGTELEKFEMLPIDNKKRPKPVTAWPNRDSAFLNVSEGIHRAVQKLRQNF